MTELKHNHRKPLAAYISLIVVLLLSATGLSAQQPWNFPSLEEACLGDAYLVVLPSDLRGAACEAAGQPVKDGLSYHISGPYRRHGVDYIRFQQLPGDSWPLVAGADFKVPEALAVRMLPHLVSHSYWQRRYSQISQWAYVDPSKVAGLLEVDTTDHLRGRYLTLLWLGYQFQSSDESPVYFTVSVEGSAPQRLSLRAVERLAEWGAFITYADRQAYLRSDQELRRQLESRQDDLQRRIDSLSSLVTLMERQDDSMAVALQDDSSAWERERSRAEVERTKARMDREQIFLMSIQPARSNQMFGLELNLYNCFPKTIVKVEVDITPYNERSRVQEDRFGRSVRTVRCMGPIPPGSPARYTFDELFWAEGTAIKFMRVTAIIFHLADGTTRSYTGYNNIMKHSLDR